MPKYTGDILAQMIYQTRPDLPVILCSGNPQLLGENRDQLPGVVQIIPKPFAWPDMAHAIREALDQGGHAANDENA